MREFPTGTVTFLFTDIEGSTRLLRELGGSYSDVLDEHDSIVRGAIESNGGVVVKTEGDAFFAAFDDAGRALTACARAQAGLAARQWEWGQVRVRMGLHTGPAQPKDRDYVSLAVNQAARVVDAAQGGQVLVTDEVRKAARDLPPDLRLLPVGRFRIRDFDEPIPLFRLAAPGISECDRVVRALPASAYNFPRPRASLVGRESELRELRECVRDARFVTLTGTGGAGKTRLALEVAADVAVSIPGGAWLVELLPLEREDLVVEEIAAALGVRGDPHRPRIDPIVERLAAEPLLLVLDNCEHLIEAVAEVVDVLLDRCPQLTVLATSRRRLEVPDELVFPVPLLAVPPAGAPPDAVASSPAVELFLDRARGVRPGFQLRPMTLPTISEICRRLDGLPLAIELAAAQLSAYAPEEIAERLAQRFELLQRRGRAASHRQVLRTVIDSSHELLTDPERTVLRRLSVLASWFRLADAERVVADAVLPASAVAAPLAELVERSLVVSIDAGRMRMLESIREYGRLRLRDDDDEASAHRRHLRWIHELVAREDEGDEAAWIELVDGYYDDVRAAMEWSLRNDPEQAVALANDLGDFFRGSWRVQEGRAWLEELIAGGHDVSGRVLVAVGLLAVLQADYEAAGEHYRRALDATDDPALLCRALNGSGNVAQHLGRFAEAQRHYEPALQLAHEHGIDRMRYGITLNLGLGALAEGDVEAAVRHYESAGALAPADAHDRAYARSGAAEALIEGGRPEEAIHHAREGLRLHFEAANLFEVSQSLDTVASLLDMLGDRPGDALRLFAAAEAIRRSIGTPLPPVYLEPRLRARVERARERAGAAGPSIWAEGESLPAEEAVAAGLAACSELERPSAGPGGPAATDAPAVAPPRPRLFPGAR